MVDELELSVKEEINNLLNSTDFNIFKDEENTLKENLQSKINQYGSVAIKAIEEIAADKRSNEYAVSEILKQIGDINDLKSYTQRLRLLEKNLFSYSPQIRDGANLGLACMDNPSSLPAFKKAYENEENKLLKKFLKKTILQLEKTKNQ